MSHASILCAFHVTDYDSVLSFQTSTVRDLDSSYSTCDLYLDYGFLLGACLPQGVTMDM